MARRKTNEEFMNELKQYEKLKNFEVVSEYIASRDLLKVKHLNCGEVWETTPIDFIRHLRTDSLKCKNCPREVCDVDNCINDKLALGYCAKHYAMHKTHGNAEKRIIKERKARTEESAIEELMNFFEEYGVFSSRQLTGKNSGLERYLRVHHEGLRGFCHRHKIEHILTESQFTKWTDELIYSTIKNIHLKYKKPVGLNLLAKEGVGGLYQWIRKTGKSYKEYCIDNGLSKYTSSQSTWSDAKCFRLIKEINKTKEIKPNAEYIKKYKKGAYNYIYQNYRTFEGFVNAFDLEEFIDLYSNMSSGEKEIESYLKRNGFSYIYQHREENCVNTKILPFDFSVNDNHGNIIALIEFDGEQHFRAVEHWGGEIQLEYTNKNDSLKEIYCIENNLPLIRIPYWKQSEIEKILSATLTKETIINDFNSSYIVNHPGWSREKYIEQSNTYPNKTVVS